MMDRYPHLRFLIEREFGSVSKFCRETAVPKSTITMLIQGKYPGRESSAIERINRVLVKSRPGSDLARIWDIGREHYEIERSQIIQIKGNKFRVLTTVELIEEEKIL
jgi:hypothetical protein